LKKVCRSEFLGRFNKGSDNCFGHDFTLIKVLWFCFVGVIFDIKKSVNLVHPKIDENSSDAG